jgi:cytochrome c oxidase subunit 3
MFSRSPSSPSQPFHLVSPSPWPLLLSISLLLTTMFFCLSLYCLSSLFFIAFFCSRLCIIGLWLTDVVFEGTLLGCHTIAVQSGLRLSIVLFILSEIMFFASFFWAYLHCSLSPNVELGSLWPPAGILPLDCTSLPLLNTFVLLVSAATVTASHSLLRSSLTHSSSHCLLASVGLGFFFLLLQGLEYYLCSFTIADSSYGSCFFLATGFHGLHVLIGTIWLSVSLPRLCLGHYSSNRHFCLESGIWYWHFVDVI